MFRWPGDRRCASRHAVSSAKMGVWSAIMRAKIEGDDLSIARALLDGVARTWFRYRRVLAASRQRALVFR